MKKKTKLGLVLAAVAAATFYVVHRLAGKKAAPHAAPETTHTTAPPAVTPKTPVAPAAPHGGTVSKPNPATPADPFKPLPGQADPGVHFDQPGGSQSGLIQDGADPGFSAHASSDDAPNASSSQGSGWGEGS